MPLPTEHWQESLLEMESTLANALRALDRADERWERAVAPSAGEGEPPVALDRIETRVQDWEERLQAAEELTASVEAELLERAAGVSRWQTLFAQWEELLQRRETTSPQVGLQGEPPTPPHE